MWSIMFMHKYSFIFHFPILIIFIYFSCFIALSRNSSTNEMKAETAYILVLFLILGARIQYLLARISFSGLMSFFSVLVSNSGFHTALHGCISLLSSNLQQILSLVFHDIDIFEEYLSFFCRRSLSVGLSDVFSLLNRNYTFLGSKNR